VSDGIVLDDVILDVELHGERPKLLLHCCCAPCASYVLRFLSEFFVIEAFFCDVNIRPQDEFEKRADGLRRLIATDDYAFVKKTHFQGFDELDSYERFVSSPFDYEGGKRCTQCYSYRLRQTAALAKSSSADCFATTLTVSTHKNADDINSLGSKIAKQYDVNYLISDFKKNGGWQQSVQLSKEHGLYRQKYCGCIDSMNAVQSGKANI